MPTPAFVRRIWQNYFAGGTAADAANLNRIEAGVLAVTDGVRAVEALVPVGAAVQTLTTGERTQARTNIGAGSAADTAQALADSATALTTANAALAAGAVRRNYIVSEFSTTTTSTTNYSLFTSVAAGRYVFEGVGRCRAGTAGILAKLGLTAPAGTTLIDSWVEQNTSATAETVTDMASINAPVGVAPGTTYVRFRIRAHLVSTTAGTLSLGLLSGTSGSPVYVEAGSTFTLSPAI